MKNVKFDKLVRDKIPDIVKNEGNSCVHEILDPAIFPDTLLSYVKCKIVEEATEVADALTREDILAELGDLCEVMLKYAKLHNIKPYEILLAAADKEKRCGKFDKNIILKEITYK